MKFISMNHEYYLDPSRYLSETPADMKKTLFKFKAFAHAGLAVLALNSLVSCNSDEDSSASGQVEVPYKVSATIGMVADVIGEIAGDRAEIETLVGPGVDPHLYKPTASDVKAMQTADIVFYSGLMLEGKMSDILVKVARKGKPVYAVTEEIYERHSDSLLIDEEEHYDPHLWMDVSLWIKAAKVIEQALAELDPEGAEVYAENAEAYISKLEKLDVYAQEVISTVPAAKRHLVTAHDAFGYMSKAYGIEVRGVQGISTESEAGLRDIEDLIDFIVDKEIPAIFVESTVSDKNIRALVEGAKQKGHTVTIGGELFSDAMGPSGTYEGTYIGMIDHNVTTLARALGGQAPEKGFQGKLSH